MPNSGDRSVQGNQGLGLHSRNLTPYCNTIVNILRDVRGSMMPVTLGERIKEALDSAKLSVTDAAKKIGVGHSAIYPWLSGKTKNLKLEHLFALAELTGYSAKWIAIEKGTKKEIKALASNEVDISFLT